MAFKMRLVFRLYLDFIITFVCFIGQRNVRHGWIKYRFRVRGQVFRLTHVNLHARLSPDTDKHYKRYYSRYIVFETDAPQFNLLNTACYVYQSAYLRSLTKENHHLIQCALLLNHKEFHS